VWLQGRTGGPVVQLWPVLDINHVDSLAVRKALREEGLVLAFERQLFLEFIKELHEISFPVCIRRAQRSEIILKFTFATYANR
jgi:hypothetical protein